ncbi:MAG TPA: hypothetical protein VM600_02990, partial [Actinomycetota bacterium]|nr:hypothetical protein [Actinomycetota bacterium]
VYPAPPPAQLNDQFSPAEFMSGAGELMDNLLNVPVRMVNGRFDPIVNYGFAAQDTAWLEAMRHDYKAWVLERRHHEVVPAMTACVLNEAVAKRRRTNPARIVFRVEPETFAKDEVSGLDLRYDAAYWISDVNVREKATVGDVVAESHALGTNPDREPIRGADLFGASDLCGNPRSSGGESWTMIGTKSVPGRIGGLNALSVTLHEVSEATLDLTRARIDTREPIALTVRWRGPSDLLLRGPWTGDVSVVADGQVRRVLTPTGDTLKLDLDGLDERTMLLVQSS